MSEWLAPVSRALDALERDINVFFRDDDAGWADARLFALLDVFDRHACPIDLAVIPALLGDPLAAALRDRRRTGSPVGFHQHGYSHDNHESHGRPCEFGPSRGTEQQAVDIRKGQQRLTACFGDDLDPIFTPPWNRCTADTGRALVANGIGTISRDATAGSLGIDGLAECPVRIDWFAKTKGRRLDRHEWGAMAARHVETAAGAVGIMLHHAAMDAAELDACEQIVRTVAAHPGVHVVPMREVVVK